MNIFEKASRKKLRFSVGKGSASVEDLWDLDLTTLDDTAIAVDKKIEQSRGKSFISTSRASSDDILRLDLLKHVIQTKMKEAADADERKAKKARVARIDEIIARKQEDALGQKSLEELVAERESLLS